MAKPEVLFCTILEQEFGRAVVLIESIITLPAFALAKLKSNFQRIDTILFQIIEAAVTVIETQLIQVLQLDLIDQSESRLAFCQIAFVCRPLRDVLFADDPDLLPFLTPQQKQDIQSDFDLFEELVCKIGLQDLISTWTNARLLELEQQLDELEDRLLDAADLDQLIQDYLDFIQGTGILELIDDLERFAQCGFEVCNFAATSENSSEEFQDRLSIESENGSFLFVADEAIQNVFNSSNRIEGKINDLRILINKFKADGTRDYQKGIPPDEIMG